MDAIEKIITSYEKTHSQMFVQQARALYTALVKDRERLDEIRSKLQKLRQENRADFKDTWGCEIDAEHDFDPVMDTGNSGDTYRGGWSRGYSAALDAALEATNGRD
jgi:hypothetical protein